MTATPLWVTAGDAPADARGACAGLAARIRPVPVTLPDGERAA